MLEPSPPAVNDGGAWMADDPLYPADPDATSPIGPGRPWDDACADDPALRDWCAARALITDLPLAPPPASLVTTRLALHRLAMYAVAPARIDANGFMGLRWTLGGFGTPFYGDGCQVRVDGTTIVVQHGDAAEDAPITSLADAARFIGVDLLASAEQDYDVPPMGDTHAPLVVDAEDAAWVSEWFAFGTAVLEDLRAAAPDRDATRVQLWPEHFDVAIELGDGEQGQRASIGFSPGDDHHDEPYAYVAPWSGTDDSPLWNAVGFRGAELHARDIALDADPRGRALAFIRAALHALGQAGP